MAPRKMNQLRIIGGSQRGRRLSFPDADGLRPTPDRVRETLFNWLQGVISGARCLDLFAGSGALGIEALSRGAQSVIWVERNPHVAHSLRGQLPQFDLHNRGQVICADAVEYLHGAAHPFEIIFLDPPFHHGWIGRCCQLLATRAWLAPRAWIYLESEQELDPLPLPENWQVLRHRRAGQVAYYLATLK